MFQFHPYYLYLYIYLFIVKYHLPVRKCLPKILLKSPAVNCCETSSGEIKLSWCFPAKWWFRGTHRACTTFLIVPEWLFTHMNPVELPDSDQATTQGEVQRSEQVLIVFLIGGSGAKFRVSKQNCFIIQLCPLLWSQRRQVLPPSALHLLVIPLFLQQVDSGAHFLLRKHILYPRLTLNVYYFTTVNINFTVYSPFDSL